MHELKKKLEPICDMMETLSTWAEEELEKGKECVNTHEMGLVIDMIKDLAKAEKDINKACYYHKIVEAMHESKEEEELMGKIFHKMKAGEELSEDERMGYDHWRYASGRFAPTGRGHRSGYIPWPAPTYVDGLMEDEMDAMTTYGDSYGMAPRPIDNFRMAKKHYTETHSEKDKVEMNQHANKHLEDTVDSMKEIWKTADPELKNKMKNDISSLLKEMG